MDYVSLIQSSIRFPGDEGVEDVELCLYGGDKVTVTHCVYLLADKTHIALEAASVVEGLESMTSNLVTSLAWVRSPGDTLVV
jgi:hypothetical protein